MWKAGAKAANAVTEPRLRDELPITILNNHEENIRLNFIKSLQALQFYVHIAHYVNYDY